jgi:hypothetical protein
LNQNIPTKEKTYDDLFKEILETFQSHLVIAFLNSTFKHNMPPDSVITPLRTELNASTRITADYFLKVTEPDGTLHYFHMEAQTKNDNRMVFRMVEYGVRFALQHTDDGNADDLLIELPHAVVFYLRDNRNTPKKLNVTIRTPDGQELHYIIPTERMSDYTPEELLEQDKFPLFPFYMLNFKGNNAEKFEREWKEGCSKLSEFVKNGRMEKAEAEKLAEGSRIVIGKTKFSDEKKEVLRKMTMFDKVGVGTDWIEIKRQKEEYAAQARNEERKVAAQTIADERKAVAEKALKKGMSLVDAAELADLPIAEVEALIAIK